MKRKLMLAGLLLMVIFQFSNAQEISNRDQYLINDSVLIKTKYGATLSAVVVRKKGIAVPQPPQP